MKTDIKKIMSKHRGQDYTTEICRCGTFIVHQVMRGISVETAFHQATGSYGFSVALNAKKAIERSLNNIKK